VHYLSLSSLSQDIKLADVAESKNDRIVLISAVKAAERKALPGSKTWIQTWIQTLNP
jgi:hypothetical protein